MTMYVYSRLFEVENKETKRKFDMQCVKTM